MRRPSAILVAAIALTLAGLRGRGAETWSYASSDHFETFAAGDDAHAREIAAAFEGFHASFSQLFNVPGGRTAPRTKLIVFASAREFAPFRPQDNSIAFWLDTPVGDFIVMQAFDTSAMPTALHEYTHLMVGRTGVQYPLWLNEGIAEFYSTMTRDGSKVRLGLPLPNAVDTLQRGGQLIPLPALFGMDDSSAEGRDAATAARFYAESWALTHMLVTSEPYRAGAMRAFEAIARGEGTMAALDAVYHRPVDAIWSDLKKYLLRFRFGSMSVELPRSAAGAQVMSAPIDQVQLDLVYGTILGWQASHQELGLEILKQLEDRAPGNLALIESRGLIEYYSQRCDTARSYLSKAIAMNSTNSAVQRAYAALTGQAPMPAPKIPPMMPAADPAVDAQVHIALTPCRGQILN